MCLTPYTDSSAQFSENGAQWKCTNSIPSSMAIMVHTHKQDWNYYIISAGAPEGVEEMVMKDVRASA